MSSLVAALAWQIALIIRILITYGEFRSPADNYWVYNGLCTYVAVMMSYQNMSLISIAIIDYTRRKQFLHQLTNALELDFEVKDSSTIKYPTINFCD